ncbi:ferrochelatase [uncultured Umboniibacter sp.]|uniref:ferrochelatase n=1 Tax=uncultured Umboniibacter sp. TaxID=1798917 RepID=UPI002621116E|nr:ferrochelatase [uncultured Umboniibacter sp.]
MKFQSANQFSHSQQDKIGLLLVNLGTPDAPTSKALRSYLREFLSDPRVVEIPRVIWMCILYLIILPLRAPKSAHAYASVWSDKGSPLMVNAMAQRDALHALMTERHGERVVTELAMRYNKPSVTSVIQSLQDQGATKLVVLPLYPQYAASTVASVFDAVAADFAKRRWLPDFRFITHYHRDQGYQAAMAKRIRDHWEKNGQAHLLLSFHGIPKRSLTLGDPYFCECHATGRLLAESLGLTKDEYTISFQSRFGKAEWLKPYTDETLKGMPAKGVKAVDVFCPGFSADCLETIEEIAIENRDYFLESGGEQYRYIEALNDMPQHISALADIAEREMSGWLTSEIDGDARQRHADAISHQLAG